MEAKAKGVKFGLIPTIDRKKVVAIHGQGIGATDIAKQAGIGRSNVYEVLREGS